VTAANEERGDAKGTLRFALAIVVVGTSITIAGRFAEAEQRSSTYIHNR
jgi:hypothetical protein